MADTPRFFGYGSLVNRASHDGGGGALRARPARLSGWLRVWRGTRLRRAAYLSVEPHACCVIDGLLAQVPGGDWAALDRREVAYEKHDAGGQITPAQPGPVALYVIPPGVLDPEREAHPVLLSYLDMVVSGFLDAFGPDGVARFFTSTAGWDGPLLDDRAAPIYPRADTATRAGRRATDAALPATGARLIAQPGLR